MTEKQKKKTSGKHLQIDKANTMMIVMIATAASILVFSLVASKALWGQAGYQKRVITEKEKAVDQLKANKEALSKLADSYKEFVSTPQNIIGGNSSGGTSENDGDNAKIVLDALPSKYDFPALVSSLEKVLSNQGYKLDSLTGTDEELTQSAVTGSQPVEIPFTVVVTGPYSSVQGMLSTLERSIRPIKIERVDITGSNADATITVEAKTYFQPEKDITVGTKEVK